MRKDCTSLARPDADGADNMLSFVVDTKEGGLEVNVGSSNIGTAHEAFGAGEPLAKVGIT